jgi:hypothetical protein
MAEIQPLMCRAHCAVFPYRNFEYQRLKCISFEMNAEGASSEHVFIVNG